MTRQRLLKAAVVTVVGALPLLGVRAWAGTEDGARSLGDGRIMICDDGECHDFPPQTDLNLDCSLYIEFVGYPKGDLTGSVTIRALPPTGDGRTLFEQTAIQIGEDAAGGASDLDALVRVDLDEPLEDMLNDGLPPSDQGWYIRFVVTAHGKTSSADEWVVNRRCIDVPPSPTPSPTESPSPSTSVSPSGSGSPSTSGSPSGSGSPSTSGSDSPSTSVTASETDSPSTTSPSNTTSVLPNSNTTGPGVGPNSGPGGSTAFTGAEVGWLAALALALLVAGALLLRLTSRDTS